MYITDFSLGVSVIFHYHQAIIKYVIHGHLLDVFITGYHRHTTCQDTMIHWLSHQNVFHDQHIIIPFPKIYMNESSILSMLSPCIILSFS
jgi:hypothetical protein